MVDDENAIEIECRICGTTCYCLGKGCQAYLVYVHCDFPDNLCNMCEECEEGVENNLR